MSRKRVKEPRGIVLVEWVDSCGNSHWQKRTDAIRNDGVGRCYSVGVVLKSDSHALTIHQSYDRACDNVDHTLTIPRCAITRIRRLKVR